ncbi:hypothetical protein PJ985_04855 [Streptomyces sp. ACA25]|uniref:hypothetical protein n=1 Tax=Streptomyces sp. ACA25 TaxID=3022596 RepID=UPI0023076A7C|nr:hypothetical protein [Streptomyces sp. ACA25]MDB1086892.1 hypothetical protein [Streptomyces sp. ACA25]
MSRETDSSSPGAGGWEPYGKPTVPGAADGPDTSAVPEEKKTETTLTTRIRINIPGSRPIPPVVMRETVQGSPTPPADRKADVPPPRAEGGPGAGEAPSGPGAARPGSGGPGSGGPGKKPISSWFEPRKPPAGGGDTPPAGTPRGDVPPGAGPAAEEPPPGGGLPPLPVRQPSGPTTGPGTGETPLLPPPPGASGPPAPPSRPLREEEPAGPPAAPFAGQALGLGAPMQDAVPSPEPGHFAGPGASPEPGPGAESAPPWYGQDSDPEETAAMPALSDPYATGGVPHVPGSVLPPQGGAPDPFPPFAESAPPPPPAPEERPVKRRGRSLLKLAGAGVVGVFVVAYGAGLVLNQDDVPKGTTVLGHEIGGASVQEAVNRLDAALDQSANAPLVLLVGNDELELKPAVAGLTIDTEATVRAASGQDYNPLTVIGSLFGAERQVAPEFAVDGEKLGAALTDLAMDEDSGAGPRNGSISFEGGVPTPFYGEEGTTVDAEAAAQAVEDAYRQRAESGENPLVEVPVTTQEPEIGRAEVERAMEEFAEPAMSGLVTVSAGGVAAIDFSPEFSLQQFVSMEPVDGKLVDSYDLEVLQSLYGSQFANVLVTRGDGSRTPVGPEDVAGALRLALRETEPEKRVGIIDLEPN